jgi:hypothetical protein
VRGHRKEMLVRRNGAEWFAQASWDDDENLRLAVADHCFSVHEDLGTDSDATVGVLLRDMAAAGLEVECCAGCSHFVYAGMGAGTGSSIGSCSEGKTETQFRREDNTDMTYWCEAFRPRAKGPMAG